MRKVLIVAFACSVFVACTSDQGGAVNDGIETVDPNGGLADTANMNNGPAIDTSKMENRVDLSKRDTLNNY